MWRFAVIVLLIAAAVGVLFWRQQQSEPFFVSGFVEAEEIRVGSRVGGRVREIGVQEGQPVKAGQTLVVLEPFDLSERLAQAKAALAAQRAGLARLEAGFRPEEIAAATAARDRAAAVYERLKTGLRPLEIQIYQDKLDVAQAELVKAENDYERYKSMMASGSATEVEMRDATKTLAVAQARAAEARNSLALAKEGPRREEIEEAAAALAQAEAERALRQRGYRSEEIDEARAQAAAAEAAVSVIQRQIDELPILAPIECVVEAIDLQPGDLIPQNAPVLSLLDTSKLWVRAYLPENRLNVSIGQKVSLRVDSFPGRRFAGHVAFIARQAEFTPANVQTPEERSKQVFRIKVMLDEGRDVLRAGMAADVLFD
ncbi:Multidrug resistance protein MdtN [Phycisphaerae bacterium RAS1]|nr:Multidrug resistance protein MdtN [Phycisphaerae bacterium RAS1]